MAHLDRSLRSAQQNRQSVCFVVDLDRQNVPNMEALQRAAKAGAGVRREGEARKVRAEPKVGTGPCPPTPSNVLGPDP